MTYADKGLLRLHLAIVLQGIADLRSDPQNIACKLWLLQDGLFILESYGQPIEAALWNDFVESGCEGNYSLVRK